MNQPSPSTNIRWSYIVLALVVLALILLRIGKVPAASGGDEVWWSDSGWFFQKEGVLRWGIMNDDKGSGHISYWPPVLPVIQGLIFSVLGLSPFSICVQSAVHSFMAFGLVWLLVRQYLGFHSWLALAAATSIMSPFHLERRLTVVRMENMTAVGALAFLWALNKALSTSQSNRRRLWYLGSGLSLSIGLLSYYPQSPMLILGAAVAIMTCRKVEAVGWVACGALPFGMLALWWLLQDPHSFYAQVLSSGTSHYFSFYNVLSPFKQLIDWNHPLSAWLALESLASLAIGLHILSRTSDSISRRLGIMCVAMSLPPFVYEDGRPVTALLLVLVWFYSASLMNLGSRARDIVSSIRITLPWITLAKMALLLFTAFYQSEGRNYNVVESALKRLDLSRGGVAISQRAWLALRERIEPDRLHFLVYSGASLLNTPVKAKDVHAEEYFSHLVLEQDKIDLLFELYPWIKRAIYSGEFIKVAEIKPHFRPLPWAMTPCYDLVVFSKKADSLIQDYSTSNVLQDAKGDVRIDY